MLNLEEEQTHLLSDRQSSPIENPNKSFKPMNGRVGTIAFLSLDSKIGGQVSCDRSNVGQFLTREQANYIYKKVETSKMIDTNIIQQEIEQEEQSNKMNDTNRETNPH